MNDTYRDTKIEKVLKLKSLRDEDKDFYVKALNSDIVLYSIDDKASILTNELSCTKFDYDSLDIYSTDGTMLDSSFIKEDSKTVIANTLSALDLVSKSAKDDIEFIKNVSIYLDNNNIRFIVELNDKLDTDDISKFVGKEFSNLNFVKKIYIMNSGQYNKKVSMYYLNTGFKHRDSNGKRNIQKNTKKNFKTK